MRSNYNTRQKDAVRMFLIQHKDMSFTAAEVYSAVAAEGVGRTTVYRVLSQLEQDGFCAKYPSKSGGGDSYQYLEKESCHEHIHYLCTECGRVGHLDCSFMDELRGHVEGGHGFCIDNERTVIYGVCSACREGNKK